MKVENWGDLLLEHLFIWYWNMSSCKYLPYNWLCWNKCPSTARWDREVNDNVEFFCKVVPEFTHRIKHHPSFPWIYFEKTKNKKKGKFKAGYLKQSIVCIQFPAKWSSQSKTYNCKSTFLSQNKEMNKPLSHPIRAHPVVSSAACYHR